MTTASTASRSAQLLSHLDAHRAALLETIRSVPPSLHHRKPSPDRWSVAEVVEHLSLTEPRIFRLLSSRIEQAPRRDAAQASSPEAVSDRLSHALILDRRRTITAGEPLRPQNAQSIEQSVAMLTAVREQIRALVASTDDIDLAAMTYPHPAFGDLDLVQWILFLGSHEARHAAQIEEVLASLQGADVPADSRSPIQ